MWICERCVKCTGCTPQLIIVIIKKLGTYYAVFMDIIEHKLFWADTSCGNLLVTTYFPTIITRVSNY